MNKIAKQNEITNIFQIFENILNTFIEKCQKRVNSHCLTAYQCLIIRQFETNEILEHISENFRRQLLFILDEN